MIAIFIYNQMIMLKSVVYKAWVALGELQCGCIIYTKEECFQVKFTSSPYPQPINK